MEWRKSTSFSESCRHAWDGVLDIFQAEKNLRILLGMFVGAVALALLLRLSALELAIIVFVSAAILAAEMFNAALEALEDIVWPEYRAAVKKSKDVSAGAVLVLSLAAIIIGVLLFGPPIIELGYGA